MSDPGEPLEYDHFLPEVYEWPYPTWERMRAAGAVVPSPHYGGFKAVTRYEEVHEAATDWHTFSSAHGTTIPALGFPPLVPRDCDPPLHREYRRILNPTMGPPEVAAQEPMMRQHAKNLIAGFDGLREFDLCEVFALPFPKLVTLDVLGFPAEDLERIDSWIESLATSRDPEIQAQAVPACIEYVNGILTSRRAEPPRDDVIGALLSGTRGEAPLDDQEIIMSLIILLFGGLHTTTTVIAVMMMWLADHPEERERLMADASLIPGAVEEFVRFASAGAHVGRTATRDTELGGCPIKAGDTVMLMLGSASFDEREFEEPMEVRIDRSPNRHFGFGIGPHRCVGMHVAKAELRIALEELLPALGDYRIGDRSQLHWTGGDARGLVTLPVIRN